MPEVNITPKEKPPAPPPGVSTLPEAPTPETLFRDVGRDTPLEQLRANIEDCVKIAGQPVDQMVAAWDRIGQLADDVDTTKMNTITFHREVAREHARVQSYIGEAKGYRAALAQAIIAFLQEEKRGPR